MARHLIVSEPFGDYARGSRITDPDAVAEILASAQVGHVLPIDADDPPPKTSTPRASG